MKYINNKKGGYSLVEVLISITVLLIALVGPLTIAYTGLKRANFSKEQTFAVFLAQEGVESVVRLREDSALNASSYGNLSEVWTTNFNAVSNRCQIGSNNYCGVRLTDDGSFSQNNIYQCSGSNCLMRYNDGDRVPYKQGVSGTETQFTRQLQITVSGNQFARVKSIVSWGPATSDKIELETYVYNTYYEPN